MRGEARVSDHSENIFRHEDPWMIKVLEGRYEAHKKCHYMNRRVPLLAIRGPEGVVRGEACGSEMIKGRALVQASGEGEGGAGGAETARGPAAKG